jgi:transcription-repair coupling factor (superfamily II helicase)
MYRRGKYLTEVAEKRLHAIREFTDLGSGFKIAMRDLEIRGAGNLLGAEQHGHMHAVGYDLYCKMLNQAVKDIKGIAKEEEKYETMLDLSVDAYIPDTYIKNEAQKLDIYKRIAGIETEEECEDMLEELTDRFGDTPKTVMNLLEIAKLKARAHGLYAETAYEERLIVIGKESAVREICESEDNVTAAAYLVFGKYEPSNFKPEHYAPAPAN